MKLNRIYTTLLSLLFCLTSFGQTTELQKIDKTLTYSFKKMTYTLAPAFKKQLISQLTKPITFDNTLDSLSKYLTIRTSADKKIKFYSWDEMGGGTWHYITCLAQFKSNNGKIIVQQLNTESKGESADFTDSEIYKVYDIFINGKKFYLTLAGGTYGSGHQHEIVQVFSIIADRLVKCTSCFADNRDLIIEYPRSKKANLVFNPKTNEITYSGFKHNVDEGFYEVTGQTITLKLINGVFVAQ